MHPDSCVMYGQRHLRCADHVHSKAVICKREQAGPVKPPFSVCSNSTASTVQNFAPTAQSRADVWANRSHLGGVLEETTCIIRSRSISHSRRSAKTITNKGNCLENAVPTERNNATDANIRLKPKLGDIVAYFKEYCDAAALHRVRYLSEDRSNFFEKMFWCLTLLLCAAGCAFMIMKVKGKLDATPVIVTFAESETNICHLPFPAVTLCPYTKHKQSLFNVTQFAEKFQNNEDFLDDYISYLGKIESKIEISDRLFYQLNGSSTWIKENFSKRKYNDTYGDNISDELADLLEQMLRNNGSLLSRMIIDENCKVTSFSQSMSPLQDNDLCKSIRKYYPIWVNETKQKMLALGPFCYLGAHWWAKTFKSSSYVLDESAEKFFLKVAASSPFVTGSSVWHYDYLPAEAWKEIWTKEGRCFTFNMINNGQIYKEDVLLSHEMYSNDSETSMDWHSDKGYSANAGINTYPRRSFSSEHNSGLILNLYDKTADIDYICNFGRTGFKIILHRPEDQPQEVLNYYVEVPFNRHASVSIKPVVMTTSPVLEKYDPRRRQCYLSHEKNLKYFKFYSRNNCLLECLTNATLRKCGCVAFYMSRNASTKICGAGSEECMYKASEAVKAYLSAEEMEIREMNEHLKDTSESEAGVFHAKSRARKTACDCLPSCLSITYEADASIFMMNPSHFLKLVTSHEKENIMSVAFALFNFKYKTFIASRRSELYGQIDFLANCGGLLGLFCGFSLISLIEFIYFMTIRLWSNILRSWIYSRKIHQNSCRA